MTSERLFVDLLDRYLTDAAIEIDVSGRRVIAGIREHASNGHVVIRVSNTRFFDRVLCYGNLGMGESYMDGDFDVERGELHDLLTVLLRSQLGERIRHDHRMLARVLATRIANALRGGGRNVRTHYDTGDDLFESFLDETLTYSCGYVTASENDLEQLQQDKLDRICRKLRLQPGDRLVDIGCGYGGLAMFAAEHYGVTTLGATISRRHHDKAAERVRARGLADRVTIRFADYRELDGEFDKLVSVGMMEHVPRRQYPQFVRSVARLLAARGIGLIHTIGRTRTTHDHDPFIQRYIFPGSDTPRLSELATQLERHRLSIIDVENLVRHYGYTVLLWLKRFRERRSQLSARYDERFRRMWEYYFACGVAASRAGHSAVWQVLFTKDHTLDHPLQRV